MTDKECNGAIAARLFGIVLYADVFAPNYCQDRNACADAEAAIGQLGLEEPYLHALARGLGITVHEHDRCATDFVWVDDAYALSTATPRQRCEAMLLCLSIAPQ